MILRFTSVSIAVLALGAIPTNLSAQEVNTGVGDVTIGGRLHVQYATSSVDDAVEDVLIRRARVRVDIRVSELLDARMQPDFAGGRAALQDAYVRLSLDPGFRVSLGQFKRAFSAFELASSTDLPTIERDGRIEGVGGCPGVGGLCSFSRLTEKLGFDGRDTGVRFDGGLGGGLSYMATITSGEGINTSDMNDGKSISGRLTYETGRFTVGGSLALHDYLTITGDETPETEYSEAYSLDLEVGTWREGFHLLAAVVRGDNWEVGPDFSFTALQGLASVYLPLESTRLAGVEPMFRVSWSEADGESVGGLLFTPGMTLYISGKNGLAANVDVFSPSRDGDTEWSFKLMTLFYF